MSTGKCLQNLSQRNKINTISTLTNQNILICGYADNTIKVTFKDALFFIDICRVGMYVPIKIFSLLMNIMKV